MKISVVIITRNRPMELNDCIDSIAKQDYLPDEVIIVDSSTTDEVKNITNEYTNLVIKCFTHFKGGMTTARNFGYGHTSGDVIAFIDDDVILHKTYVCNILNYFKNNTDIGAITGPTYDLADIILCNSSDIEMNNLLNNTDSFFKTVRNEIERFSGLPFDLLYIKHLNNKSKRTFVRMFRTFFILDSFRLGKMLPSGFGSIFYPLSDPYDVERLNGCNMSFRKKVLDEYKFDEKLEMTSNYAIYEDHEMGYRVSRKYRISMVPTILLHHKKTPTSRVDYLNYYEAIVVNVYYIVKNDLGHIVNKLAFTWSLFGIICALSAICLLKPSKENTNKLNGILNGLRRIFTGRL